MSCPTWRTASGFQALTDNLVARLEKSPSMPAFVVGIVKILPQFSAYTAVSVLALATDLASYFLLIAGGWPVFVAGVTGYAIGMLVHFVLSRRFVFERAACAKSEPRLFGEFALSGVAGLAVTASVIATATGAFAASPVTAKLSAVIMSFIVVYSIRRLVVFAAAPAK
jgi:putative flippase GtrA